MCERLTSYITSIGGTCSADHAITDSGNNNELTADNVQFVAANGVRFWISQRYPDNNVSGPNSERLPKFFIIYADLNGEKRPNTMDIVPGVRDPDIFAFAALETGRICPLGLPEVDSRFMTTRIMYRDETVAAGQNNQDNDIRFSQTSQEYIKSQAEAWGYYSQQIPNEVAFTPEDYMEEAPLSYNGYIRSQISDNSKIYAFLGNQTMQQYFQEHFAGTDLRSAAPADGGYGCDWRSGEQCDVIVDKYVW